MSKESIVQKILSDAETRANSFIAEQTAKADEIIAAAAEECKAYCYSFKAETDKMISEIKERGKTVADLEVRKLQLASKAKVLDAVYASALEKMKSLDGETCKKLLLGMLEAAEDGDTVTVGKGQADVLSHSDIEEFANAKGIRLYMSGTYGDFDGLVLTSKGVDKVLTFDVEIALLREETETQIAKELFG